MLGRGAPPGRSKRLTGLFRHRGGRDRSPRRGRSGRTDGVCGRYVSVQERADLVELYNATAVGAELAPSYNVAPTTEVYAVVGIGAELGEGSEAR